MNKLKIITNGIVRENPTFVLLLGMCPTLATTTSAIRVVSDQWRTPTYVGDVSDGVQRLIENTANGIFHICGDECMTIAEIAFHVADCMKLDRSLIHPITTKDMKEATPRPRFSGMSIAKARTILGYRPRMLKEILMEWDN